MMPTVSDKLRQQRMDNLIRWVWTGLAQHLGALDARGYDEYEHYMEDYKARYRLAEEGAEYITLRNAVEEEDWDVAFEAFIRYINEH